MRDKKLSETIGQNIKIAAVLKLFSGFCRKSLVFQRAVQSGLLLTLSLFIFTAPTLAQTTSWYRGILKLSVSHDECKNRDQRALEAEGYTIENQGGDLSGDYYFAGYKDIYNAVIACNTSPEGSSWANFFIASGNRDSSDPGAERVKLSRRMSEPNSTSSSSGLLVGTWEGTSGDGRFREVWIITENSGRWSVTGGFYDKQSGQKTGGFYVENTRFQNGVLSFRMIFAPKPHQEWTNSVEFSSVTVRGDSLTSKHQYGGGTLTRKR